MPDPRLSQLSPDEECFREHLAGYAFCEGAAEGRWGLQEIETVRWPNVVIWVSAAPRVASPTRYFLFLNLEHYPKVGPTAYLWDPATNAKLELGEWPKGGGNVGMVFRTNWNDAAALYAPWDRLAAANHHEWPPKHAGLLWAPKHTIVNYLRPTHALLNCDDYAGV